MGQLVSGVISVQRSLIHKLNLHHFDLHPPGYESSTAQKLTTGFLEFDVEFAREKFGKSAWRQKILLALKTQTESRKTRDKIHCQIVWESRRSIDWNFAQEFVHWNHRLIPGATLGKFMLKYSRAFQLLFGLIFHLCFNNWQKFFQILNCSTIGHSFVRNTKFYLLLWIARPQKNCLVWRKKFALRWNWFAWLDVSHPFSSRVFSKIEPGNGFFLRREKLVLCDKFSGKGSVLTLPRTIANTNEDFWLSCRHMPKGMSRPRNSRSRFWTKTQKGFFWGPGSQWCFSLEDWERNTDHSFILATIKLIPTKTHRCIKVH